jgi:LysR family transcriptional regulator, transcriptional activator of the cysJI operon
MDLHHLKTFVTLAKVGHFNRAAELLFLTQPAVSTHIKSLEEYYGFALFQKVDQKYELTEPGKILLGHVEKVFNILNETKRALDGFKSLDFGSLSIGASSNIGVYLLPQLLGEFKSLFPKIDIQVSIGPTYSIESKMLSNEIDLGIVETPAQSNEILMDFQWDEKLVVIVSPKHPWAKARKIEPFHLTEESFVVGERGSGTKKVLDESLGKIANELKVLMELGSTEAVKRAVEQNLGISIVMDCCVSREIKFKTLKAVKLSGIDLRKKISVVHLKGKYLTPSYQEFVKFLRQAHTSHMGPS